MSTLGWLMCQVYLGNASVFPQLLNVVKPQWAPYRNWGQSSATSDDLRQELWITLWQELQRKVPWVIQSSCRGEMIVESHDIWP